MTITVKIDARKGLKRFKGIRKDALEKVKNAVKVAGFVVDRNAKKLAPVDTGRLRASIHPEFKDTASFTYAVPGVGTFSGKLDEKPKDDFSVIIGSNVSYAEDQEKKHKFLERGARIAERSFNNDIQRIFK